MGESMEATIYGFAQTKSEQTVQVSDISETHIRETMPEILDLLLIDRTKSGAKTPKNIIWGNDNYKKYGYQKYSATNEIKPELITGLMEHIIMPRALKSRELQKERTKSRAEVFTPTWVVKQQNDCVDSAYVNDTLEMYVKRTWLEITCGEAPYMVTRYDMETGEPIALSERVGFVDRKLQRIHDIIIDKVEWDILVSWAFKSSFGFEWNGDSLLLARENLLYTYNDFYVAKWGFEPSLGELMAIAEIISYNVFQMDGLKYIIPLSEVRERVSAVQMSLFDDEPVEETWITRPGKRVKIMNWESNKMEFFDKGIKA